MVVITWFDHLLHLKQIIIIRWLRKRGVKIDSNVEIGRYVYFDTLFPNLLTIEDKVTLARGVQILTHDSTRLGPNTKETLIEHGSFIGVGAIIMPGVHLGRHCIIGAGSVVTHDVPAWHVAAGNPARVLREVPMKEKHATL